MSRAFIVDVPKSVNQYSDKHEILAEVERVKLEPQSLSRDGMIEMLHRWVANIDAYEAKQAS
jgi:hypothetical protein